MLSLEHETPITFDAVARKLEITARTVRKWANKGRAGRKLEVLRIGHRTVRTTWSAVDDFLSCDVPATPAELSAETKRAFRELASRHGIKIDPRGEANDCQSGKEEVSALR